MPGSPTHTQPVQRYVTVAKWCQNIKLDVSLEAWTRDTSRLETQQSESDVFYQVGDNDSAVALEGLEVAAGWTEMERESGPCNDQPLHLEEVIGRVG